MIKKIVLFAAALMVLAGLFFSINSFGGVKEDIIYNYMEHQWNPIELLVLDDHIVILDSINSIRYRDKQSQEMLTLADNAFNYQYRFAFLIASKGNTVYYVVREKNYPGSAIYSFDLDSYRSERLQSYNTVVNYASFLGMGDFFGVKYPVSDSMSFNSQRGRYLVVDKSFMTEKETLAHMKQFDEEDLYFIPENTFQIASNKDKVVFINNMNELVCFDTAAEQLSRLTDEKVTDFFITDEQVYYYAANKNGGLYRTDFNGGEKQYITDLTFTDIRLKEYAIYAVTADGELYQISDNTVSLRAENIFNQNWDVDMGNVYLYDRETKNIEVLRMKS